jgi:hypothetical protein
MRPVMRDVAPSRIPPCRCVGGAESAECIRVRLRARAAVACGYGRSVRYLDMPIPCHSPWNVSRTDSEPACVADAGTPFGSEICCSTSVTSELVRQDLTTSDPYCRYRRNARTNGRRSPSGHGRAVDEGEVFPRRENAIPGPARGRTRSAPRSHSDAASPIPSNRRRHVPRTRPQRALVHRPQRVERAPRTHARERRSVHGARSRATLRRRPLPPAPEAPSRFEAGADTVMESAAAWRPQRHGSLDVFVILAGVRSNVGARCGARRPSPSLTPRLLPPGRS